MSIPRFRLLPAAAAALAIGVSAAADAQVTAPPTREQYLALVRQNAPDALKDIRKLVTNLLGVELAPEPLTKQFNIGAATAALFPGQPEAVRPSAALAAAVHNAPKPPPVRITCTYRLINAAANVLFLVAGTDKALALREVLRGSVDVARLPAQGVRPKQGALVWLVDTAAAKEL